MSFMSHLAAQGAQFLSTLTPRKSFGLTRKSFEAKRTSNVGSGSPILSETKLAAALSSGEQTGMFLHS